MNEDASNDDRVFRLYPLLKGCASSIGAAIHEQLAHSTVLQERILPIKVFMRDVVPDGGLAVFAFTLDSSKPSVRVKVLRDSQLESAFQNVSHVTKGGTVICDLVVLEGVATI